MSPPSSLVNSDNGSTLSKGTSLGPDLNPLPFPHKLSSWFWLPRLIQTNTLIMAQVAHSCSQVFLMAYWCLPCDSQAKHVAFFFSLWHFSLWRYLVIHDLPDTPRHRQTWPHTLSRAYTSACSHLNWCAQKQNKKKRNTSFQSNSFANLPVTIGNPIAILSVTNGKPFASLSVTASNLFAILPLAFGNPYWTASAGQQVCWGWAARQISHK